MTGLDIGLSALSKFTKRELVGSPVVTDMLQQAELMDAAFKRNIIAVGNQEQGKPEPKKANLSSTTRDEGGSNKGDFLGSMFEMLQEQNRKNAETTEKLLASAQKRDVEATKLEQQELKTQQEQLKTVQMGGTPDTTVNDRNAASGFLLPQEYQPSLLNVRFGESLAQQRGGSPLSALLNPPTEETDIRQDIQRALAEDLFNLRETPTLRSADVGLVPRLLGGVLNVFGAPFGAEPGTAVFGKEPSAGQKYRVTLAALEAMNPIARAQIEQANLNFREMNSAQTALSLKRMGLSAKTAQQSAQDVRQAESAKAQISYMEEQLGTVVPEFRDGQPLREAYNLYRHVQEFTSEQKEKSADVQEFVDAANARIKELIRASAFEGMTPEQVETKVQKMNSFATQEIQRLNRKGGEDSNVKINTTRDFINFLNIFAKEQGKTIKEATTEAQESAEDLQIIEDALGPGFLETIRSLLFNQRLPDRGILRPGAVQRDSLPERLRNQVLPGDRLLIRNGRLVPEKI